MRQTANKSRFTDATYTAAMKNRYGAGYWRVAENTKYDASKIAEHFRDNALVVAYAPFEDPKIVLAVVMENAGWGGAMLALSLAPCLMNICLEILGNRNHEYP